MNYLRKHKELIPLAAVIIVISYAAFNLFANQPESSRFTRSGATILSSQVTGGAGRCNIPTYEEYSKQRPPQKNRAAAKDTVDRKSNRSSVKDNF